MTNSDVPLGLHAIVRSNHDKIKLAWRAADALFAFFYHVIQMFCLRPGVGCI